MTRQLYAVLTGLVLLLASEPRALAQDATDLLKNKKARNAYREGSALSIEADFTGAIKSYEKAYSLEAHFLIQCSIALCYQELKKLVEAAERYKRCLSEGGDKTSFAKNIQMSLDKVQKRIAHVEVTSPGEGGTVYIDGKRRGRAPQQLAVNPGTCVIEVRRQGATAATTTIEVEPGQLKTVSLVPTPEVVLTQTPKPEPHPAPPRPSRRRVPSYWFWASAGLSVALATIAIALGGTAWSLREDYFSNPSPDSYQAVKDRQLVTNVFAFTAGAVAAGTTVLFFFTDFGGRSKAKEAEAETSVYGLGLQGTF
jgi:tetratricopeptide (TPR) repeat protein